MPIIFVFGLIALYATGSLGAQFLINVGILNSSFYVLSPMRPEHYTAAMHGIIAFSVSLVVFRFFLARKITIYTKSKISKNVISVKVSQMSALAIIVLSVLFTILQWHTIEAEFTARHSGNHAVQRISLLSSVVLIILLARLPLYWILPCVFLAIYYGTIGAAASSNRSTLLPFLAAAGLFLVRKNYFFALLFVYGAIVALVSAFSARGLPSFMTYWDMYFHQFVRFDFYYFLILILNPSLPGLSTLSVIFDSTQQTSRSFFEYILYIAPLPSRIYPSNFFEDMSLSYNLGIDRRVLGINFDIYSEGFYWFGNNFHWLHAIVLAFFCVLPFFILSKTVAAVNQIHLAIVGMVLIYLVFGGMVFSFRAASRPLLLICLVFVSMRLFRIFRISKLK